MALRPHNKGHNSPLRAAEGAMILDAVGQERLEWYEDLQPRHSSAKPCGVFVDRTARLSASSSSLDPLEEVIA